MNRELSPAENDRLEQIRCAVDIAISIGDTCRAYIYSRLAARYVLDRRAVLLVDLPDR